MAEPQMPTVPHFGRRFEEALGYALALHGAQVRRRAPVPYISHLLAVCSIVMEDAGDEDAAVAALLHDAVEDHGGRPRLADIEHRFGAAVAEIVEACSDSLAEDSSTKEDWRTRKERYLARLETETDRRTLVVALADKLHNARCVATDVRSDGAAWSRFTASPADTAWYYGECLRILRSKLPDDRFVADLAHAVDELANLARMARAAG